MLKKDKIRVLLVDDNASVREEVKAVLDDTPDVKVVAEADNGEEALRRMRANALDVVVLDLSMPGMSGSEVLRRVVFEKLKPPVVIFSSYPKEQYATALKKRGAMGYVTKGTSPDELVSEIRRAASESGISS